MELKNEIGTLPRRSNPLIRTLRILKLLIENTDCGRVGEVTLEK